VKTGTLIFVWWSAVCNRLIAMLSLRPAIGVLLTEWASSEDTKS